MNYLWQFRWLWLLLGAIGASVVAPLPALADGFWPLQPKGPNASQIATLFQLLFWIALGILTTVEGTLLIAVIRFRYREGRQARQFYGNTKLEVLWTVVPFIIVVFIAIMSWPVLRDANDVSGAGMEVDVIGRQWFWQYRYVNTNVTTFATLYIPANTRVRLNVTAPSDDVIHSFWVPELGGKQDAIPGQVNSMWIQADEPGTYRGQCAEFCGLAHHQMLIQVVALPLDEFRAWLAKETGSQASPPYQAGDPAQGERAFLSGPCAACHTVAGTSARGTVGPELTSFGQQGQIAGVLENTPESLAKWLKEPAAVKTGTGMPNLNLEPQAIADLVAYLEALKR